MDASAVDVLGEAVVGKFKVEIGSDRLTNSASSRQPTWKNCHLDKNDFFASKIRFFEVVILCRRSQKRQIRSSSSDPSCPAFVQQSEVVDVSGLAQYEVNLFGHRRFLQRV